MGACYDVDLSLRVTDEKKAVELLNGYISSCRYASFDLDNFKKKGRDRNNLDDIITLFLTDRNFTADENHNYSSGFDASYGWESVMMDMFYHLEPVLKEGSVLRIFPDEDYDELIYEKGKVVQVH